jgi:hypothetical protein
MGRASPRNGGIVKLMSRTHALRPSLIMLSALLLSPLAAQAPQPPARPVPKRVLAWGDTLTAFQHDSISHALATMERLGHDSGAYDDVTPGNAAPRK